MSSTDSTMWHCTAMPLQVEMEEGPRSKAVRFSGLQYCQYSQEKIIVSLLYCRTTYNYILPSRHVIMYPILDIVISRHSALSIYYVWFLTNPNPKPPPYPTPARCRNYSPPVPYTPPTDACVTD